MKIDQSSEIVRDSSGKKRKLLKCQEKFDFVPTKQICSLRPRWNEKKKTIRRRTVKTFFLSEFPYRKKTRIPTIILQLFKRTKNEEWFCLKVRKQMTNDESSTIFRLFVESKREKRKPSNPNRLKKVEAKNSQMKHFSYSFEARIYG